MPQSSNPEEHKRPRSLTVVVAGWTLLGVAGALLAAGAVLLVPFAWFMTADATQADRASAFRDLATTFALLTGGAGLAFVVAWGLHGLRSWAWWLAVVASVGLAAFFGGRLAATHDPLFGLLIGFVVAGSAALARPSVRSRFDVRR